MIKDIAGAVGNTPLVSLENFCARRGLNAKIAAKLEFLNPAGSVKDRAALQMVEGAERQGRLKRGYTIVEPTSGNTGIALAAIGAARGYRVIIVMPADMSEERKKILRLYGAELVLTDPSAGMAGAVERAQKIASSTENSVLLDQFGNPDNPLAHYNSTAPEIWRDADGNIDFFVAGVGTGGTISGVGKYLKERNPQIKIVAVEPLSSPYLSRKIAGKHKIQGIGAGFSPDNLDRSLIDEIIPVPDDGAFSFSWDLAKEEGISAGISSGAALYASVQIAARRENAGKTVITLFPDGGERYLSL